MSIFDPQQVYYHRQKSTRKGQVIQKSPQPRWSAIDESQIPRAINVLKSYGYEIFPPTQHAIKTYFEPFNIQESNLTARNLTWSINGLMSHFKATYPRLQTFIQQNRYPNHSHVAIALTSAMFFTTGGHATFKFFNNNILTINSSQNQEDTTATHSYLYGPNISNSQYYLAYDKDMSTSQLSTQDGQIVTRTRVYNTDLTGMISHGDVIDKWSEIISSSGLADNINLANANADSTDTTLTGYIMQGYLLIELN